MIEDDDNPPLNLKGASVVFAELPWIYFEGDGGPVVARYGDPELSAPHYDLEATRESLHIDTVPEASWGNPRTLSPAEPTAMTPPMPTGGAPMDRTAFRYLRSIPAGEAGLIAVPLDAATLAHSAGPSKRFADVRVMDSDGRQVPYILERRDEPLVIGVSLESREAPAHTVNAQTSGLTSYYRLRLPFSKLPTPRLVLTTTLRVFERNVTVAVEQPADERHRDAWLQPITSSRWTHTDRDTPPPSLTLQMPATDATDLLVTLAEGDNSRLPIASAQLLLPAYRLRLFRENGAALRMAYGRTDIGPPAYDFALLAPQVLGVAAREVVAGLLSPALFWSVLVVAAVVLVALLARLLKREPPASPAA
jgi:hypothetical protein